MERFTLNKSEKLKSRKAIEELFRSGSSLSSPPFRLIYRRIYQDISPSFLQNSEKVSLEISPVLMTVAVPKKLIRKAVHRNLLKRRTREAYRLNKSSICAMAKKKNVHYEFLFLYQATEIVDYSIIRNSIQALLYRLTEKIQNS
jgi:ribonuclease P protein component